jgi:ribonuclease HII
VTVRPTLRLERSLLRERCTVLACADEVGRGALSGPVTVGVVAVTADTRTAPQGVRDSKLLTPDARQRLAPKVRRWARTHGAGHGVGHASPAEIDDLGIMAAMRLAARRALVDLSPSPDLVLLDGNHDYLTEPDQGSLFDVPVVPLPPVVTAVKADLRCAAVAAASILAKTERDALMVELAAQHPEYGWHENKGYASPAHVEALRVHGPSDHHRRSWSLPGCTPAETPAGRVPGSGTVVATEQPVESR